MSTLYTVQQGDCLSTIASEHGFTSWRTIYDSDENAEFRRLRPDPNLIYPKDTLYIPDRDQKKESCGTEARHRFELISAGVTLRIVLRDSKGDVLPGKKYRLRVDGMEDRTGTTQSDGMLIERLNPAAKTGNLDLWMDASAARPSFRWRLRLGALDPIEKLSGVQARLNNLGFNPGPIDGLDGPQTQAAVTAFQKAFGLLVDGIVGPQTRGKLNELHGW